MIYPHPNQSITTSFWYNFKNWHIFGSFQYSQGLVVFYLNVLIHERKVLSLSQQQIPQEKKELPMNVVAIALQATTLVLRPWLHWLISRAILNPQYLFFVLEDE